MDDGRADSSESDSDGFSDSDSVSAINPEPKWSLCEPETTFGFGGAPCAQYPVKTETRAPVVGIVFACSAAWTSPQLVAQCRYVCLPSTVCPETNLSAGGLTTRSSTTAPAVLLHRASGRCPLLHPLWPLPSSTACSLPTTPPATSGKNHPFLLCLFLCLSCLPSTNYHTSGLRRRQPVCHPDRPGSTRW